MASRITMPKLLNKEHVSSNSKLDITWDMPENNYSLDEKPTHQEHALFATPLMQTHGYTYCSNFNNQNPCFSNKITQQSCMGIEKTYYIKYHFKTLHTCEHMDS